MVKCKQCNKEFIVKRNAKGYYCSSECFHKSTRKRTIVPCDYCGTNNEKLISRVNRDTHNFCGHSCRNKFYLIKDMSELSRSQMRTRIFDVKEKQCELCGYNKYVEVHHIDKTRKIILYKI